MKTKPTLETLVVVSMLPSLFVLDLLRTFWL